MVREKCRGITVNSMPLVASRKHVFETNISKQLVSDSIVFIGVELPATGVYTVYTRNGGKQTDDRKLTCLKVSEDGLQTEFVEIGQVNACHVYIGGGVTTKIKSM